MSGSDGSDLCSEDLTILKVIGSLECILMKQARDLKLKTVVIIPKIYVRVKWR
jgi:hypothetical protein